MKTGHLILLVLFVIQYFAIGQSTHFEINASESLIGSKMLVADKDIYYTFQTESSNVYTTYLAKWDIKTEKILWCKKIALNNNISILPVKIIRLSNGSFVLGATDYASSNGFMNGKYTFIQFDQNGEMLKVKRLGSATGGQLRDILDDGDHILFLGDRINVQNAYRTILGRLDKDLNVMAMKSVAKEYYTYGNALRKDKSGNVYTVGFTRPAIGSRRAMISKWRPDLSHEKSLIQMEDDPNTAFSYLFIDDDNRLHIGGNFGNLATYVHLDHDLNFLNGHEFNNGNVQNIWQDNNGKTQIFIEGPNYFVSVDKNQNIRFEAQYLNNGNSSAQFADDNQYIYTYGYGKTPDNTVNSLYLMKHEYKLDRECFLTSRSGDFNGPLRRDNFGIAQGLELRNEAMTPVVPTDITVSNFDVQIREICRIDDISTTYDNIRNEQFYIVPNPARDYIEFMTDNYSEVRIVEVFNLSGQKLIALENPAAKNTIDITQISNGLYILLLHKTDGTLLKSKFHVIR
jgi:hypothetical protein